MIIKEELIIITDSIEKSFLQDEYEKIKKKMKSNKIYYEEVDVRTIKDVRCLSKPVRERIRTGCSIGENEGNGKIVVMRFDRSVEIPNSESVYYLNVSVNSFCSILEEVKRNK